MTGTGWSICWRPRNKLGLGGAGCRPTNRDVAPHPRHDLAEPESPGFVDSHYEGEGVVGIRGPWRVIEREKRVGGGERRALVAVNKRMVLTKALPESGCLLDQIRITTGLWAVERCFQQAVIANSAGPALPLDLVLVQGENLDEGEAVGHLASFL